MEPTSGSRAHLLGSGGERELRLPTRLLRRNLRPKITAQRSSLVSRLASYLASRNTTNSRYDKLLAANVKAVCKGPEVGEQSHRIEVQVPEIFPSIKLEFSRSSNNSPGFGSRLKGLTSSCTQFERSGSESRRRASKRTLLRAPIMLAAIFSFILTALLTILFGLSAFHHELHLSSKLPSASQFTSASPSSGLVRKLLAAFGSHDKQPAENDKSFVSDTIGQSSNEKTPEEMSSFDRALEVETECGRFIGKPEEDGGLAFYGLAYATAPVGERRWKRPRPIWLDEEACKIRGGSGAMFAAELAHKQRSHCAQLSPVSRRFSGSEDCLYLDIYTPKLDQLKKLPVMVYFHGGFLSFGSSGQGQVNWMRAKPSAKLAAELQVVMVAPNFRLQALGFISLQELAHSNGPEGSEGNYGLWDQLVALHWIKRNIEAFGGDPGNICIFGPDSAAAIVLALLDQQAESPNLEQLKSSSSRLQFREALEQMHSHDLFHSIWLTNPTLYFHQSSADTKRRYLNLYSSSMDPLEEKQHQQETRCNSSDTNEFVSCLMSLSAEQVARMYLGGEDPANRLDDQNSLPIHGIFADQLVSIDDELISSDFLRLRQAAAATSVIEAGGKAILLGSSAQAVDFWPCPRNLNHWKWTDFQRYAWTSLNSFSQENAFAEASEIYQFPARKNQDNDSRANNSLITGVEDSKLKKFRQKSARETYLTMVSDIRQVCPINELARNLTQNRQNHKIFRYIVESRPSPQLRGEQPEAEVSHQNEMDEGSDMRLPEFAFHTWDLIAFFGFEPYLKGHDSSSKVKLSERDLKFQTEMRNMVHDFVHSRKLHSNLIVLGPEGEQRQLSMDEVERGYKVPECELWRKYLGNAYAWLS